MNIADPNFNTTLEKANRGDVDAQVEVANGFYSSGKLEKAHYFYSSVIDKRNDAIAYYSLATMLYIDKYPEENYALAEKYFSKAVELGDTNANYYLSEMYMDGIGVLRDPARAIALMEDAANKGNMYAQRAMGWQYLNGLAVEQNAERARELFAKASEQGEPWSKFHLGKMYDKGTVTTGDVNKDAEYAVELIRKAAEAGVPDAQYSLSYYYENANVVEKDDALALKWLTEAANNNHSAAQNLLGAYYCEGKLCKQNYDLAREWFEKAALSGHTTAMKNLANMYYFGTGVDTNPIIGFEWMMKSAQAGNAEAQDEIGIEYCTGQVVDQDYTLARVWFEQAANQGNKAAMFHIFQMLCNGYGYEKNEQEAYGWLLRAAQCGNTEAQVVAGMWNVQGKDFLPVDYHTAKYWFEQAADAGDPEALHNLAVIYEKGWGVEKNLVLHDELIEKAANAGYETDIVLLISKYAAELAKLQNERRKAIEANELVLSEIPEEKINTYRKWIQMGLDSDFCFAKYQYGCELISGLYYPRNIGEGIRLLHESADCKHKHSIFAMKELAEIYSEGIIVPSDCDVAMHYAQRYMESGERDGAELMNKVQTKLSESM